MNQLEKAKEHLYAVNQAMDDYERADKEYQELANATCSFKVMVDSKELDITAYKKSVEDFMRQIIEDMNSTRKCVLESAQRRLAVLIGDKETFSAPCEDANLDEITSENEKEEETLIGDGKPLKIENTALDVPEKSEPPKEKLWYDKELLTRLYITDDMSVKDIALKLGCKTGDVYNGLSKHNIQKLKNDKFVPGKQDFSKKKKVTPSKA